MHFRSYLPSSETLRREKREDAQVLSSLAKQWQETINEAKKSVDEFTTPSSSVSLLQLVPLSPTWDLKRDYDKINNGYLVKRTQAALQELAKMQEPPQQSQR